MLEDIEVTLLSKEEYFGSDKKSIFKRNPQLKKIKRKDDIDNKNGAHLASTHLVGLSGGKVDSNLNKQFSWTRTPGKYNQVVVIDNEQACEYDSNAIDAAIRPVLKLPTKVSEMFSNIKHSKYYHMDYVYLGVYPHYATVHQTSMYGKYIHKQLEKTGKVFHLNNQIYEEYEDVSGHKFIHYKVEKSCDMLYCAKYSEKSDAWITVEPVRWLIDYKTNTLVSEHNLLAGVRFNKGGYDGNFENTEMYDFLNNVMFRDIFQDYLPKKEETKEENKDTILNWIKELLKKTEEIKDENDKVNIAKDLMALAKLYTDELIKIKGKEPNKYGDERNLIAGIMPYYVYIDGEIKREINEDNKDKENLEINNTIDNLIEKASLIENEGIRLEILNEIEELKQDYLRELFKSKRPYQRIDFNKPLEKRKYSNGYEAMEYTVTLTLKPTRPILIKELVERELAISKRIDRELASNNIRGEFSEIEKYADEIMKR